MKRSKGVITIQNGDQKLQRKRLRKARKDHTSATESPVTFGDVFNAVKGAVLSPFRKGWALVTGREKKTT